MMSDPRVYLIFISASDGHGDKAVGIHELAQEIDPCLLAQRLKREALEMRTAAASSLIILLVGTSLVCGLTSAALNSERLMDGLDKQLQRAV
jgi:hypothetical protein